MIRIRGFMTNTVALRDAGLYGAFTHPKPTIRQGLRLHNPRKTPHLSRRDRLRGFVVAGHQDNAKGEILLQAALDHQAVAHLKNMQRHDHLRKKNQVQRKERNLSDTSPVLRFHNKLYRGKITKQIQHGGVGGREEKL